MDLGFVAAYVLLRGGEAADRAASAILYAGAPDLDAIDAPRRVRAVADDDEVFGLRVVARPQPVALLPVLEGKATSYQHLVDAVTAVDSPYWQRPS